MMLFFKETLLRLRVDELTFFRIAHIWCFGTDPDLSCDLVEYNKTKKLPPYADRYLEHIRQTHQ